MTAMRQIGFTANRRLLRAQTVVADQKVVAQMLAADRVLTVASSQGYPPCAFTRRLLGFAD